MWRGFNRMVHKEMGKGKRRNKISSLIPVLNYVMCVSFLHTPNFMKAFFLPMKLNDFSRSQTIPSS